MKIPLISCLEVVRRLKNFGFVTVRQRGSHAGLDKSTAEGTIKLTVPLHSELKRGTFHHNLKDTGISLEEFEK